MKTNIQKKILKSIKIYLRAVREKGIDTAKSIFCYFACWEETPGFLLINKNKNSFFKILRLILNLYMLLANNQNTKLLT